MGMGRKVARFTIVAFAFSALAFTGCKKGPDVEQLNRLEEARLAAESAELTHNQKKQERMELERQVASKQGELAEHEAERDDLQQKMQEHQQ